MEHVAARAWPRPSRARGRVRITVAMRDVRLYSVSVACAVLAVSGGCLRGFGCDHLRATVDWLVAVSWLAKCVLA